MTNTELPVFNPFREIEIAGEKILVRELSWPNALAFFNKLREQTKNLLDAKGNLALDATKIMDAIGDNVDLVNWIVQKTTGKDAAWIEQRSLSEMLELLTHALEVNLGVIASKIKNVRSRLTGLVQPAAPTPTLNPTSPASAT